MVSAQGFSSSVQTNCATVWDSEAHFQSESDDDTVIYLVHKSLSYLDEAGSSVRIIYFDFSSAINTIQPTLLNDKLECTGVDHHLTTWIRKRFILRSL